MSNSDTSTPVILDFVSQFIAKVLEKDRNYSYYLKQWNSFRDLLSETPFNFSQTFAYLEGIGSPSKPTHSHLVPHHKFKDNTITSFGSHETLPSSIEARRTYSYFDENLKISLTNVGLYKQDDWKSSQFSISSFALESDRTSKKLSFDVLPKDLLNDETNGSFYHGKLLESSSLSTKEETNTQKNMRLSFLTQKAKKLKDRFEKNADIIAESQSATKDGSYDILADIKKLLPAKVNLYDNYNNSSQTKNYIYKLENFSITKESNLDPGLYLTTTKSY